MTYLRSAFYIFALLAWCVATNATGLFLYALPTPSAVEQTLIIETDDLSTAASGSSAGVVVETVGQFSTTSTSSESSSSSDTLTSSTTAAACTSQSCSVYGQIAQWTWVRLPTDLNRIWTAYTTITVVDEKRSPISERTIYNPPPDLTKMTNDKSTQIAEASYCMNGTCTTTVL
jgi:hypothetical protein